MWLLNRLYIFSKIIRHTITLSVFGYVSVCHKNPSCSQFFIETYKTKGIFAAIKLGIPRIISCY
ncbi:membrane protein insertion efficiency factor YidD [Candidatus Woesebacteria bacterium]|nr:membrane protein insertion efficiency factor YidD [Candidatus Woesebacteria bacterium]